MNIIEVPVGKLIPYENNPRIISEEAVDVVAASIEAFDFQQPIVIDKNYVVIAGHTRLKAAKQLGLETVPCKIADELNDAEAAAYRLADNKTGEFSKWDFEKLPFETQKLETFKMEQFGFETAISPDDFTDEFELPDGDKSDICTMTFTVHAEQKSLIEYAISIVEDSITETFGNTNKNGNALYEVVREWAEQRKS